MERLSSIDDMRKQVSVGGNGIQVLSGIIDPNRGEPATSQQGDKEV